MGAGRILLVEDDVDHASLMERALHNVTNLPEIRHAPTGAAALAAFAEGAIDLVLLDLSLPDLDGMEVLRHIRSRNRHVPVVVVTAADCVRRGVEAMKTGANEYVVKDAHYLEALPLLVVQVGEHGRRRRHRAALKESASLSRRPGAAAPLPDIIGVSRPIQNVRALVARATEVPVNVLIEGETGVGKEVVARTIHFLGPRRHRLFAPVNCAAIPESLLESEFFGHTKGAFTGAHQEREGLFDAADGGTLFLDEIEDLSPMLQGKLLRVLQDREFKPLGSNRYRTCDVRIIAAANRDLGRLASEGRFRQDLYYRLKVLPIRIPPLRERREDIPLLIRHFIADFNRRHGTQFAVPSSAALTPLRQHGWPGNVRELENIVERVLVTSDGDQIDGEAFARTLRGAGEGTDESERLRILQALERNRWRREVTARELGLSRVTLWRKMVKHGLAETIASFRSC